MCSPAFAGVAITLASAAYAGVQQHAANQYQEAIQNRNAQVSEFQAEDAAKKGGFAAEQMSNRVSQIEGSQRAAVGASGIQSDTGTVGNVLSQTAQYGQLDVNQIRSNALRAAWGYRQQEAGYQSEAELYRAAGDNQGVGTILNGLSQAYGMYGAMAKPGTRTSSTGISSTGSGAAGFSQGVSSLA